MAVTKGALKSVRMANLRLRIKGLDELRWCGVYRLGGTPIQPLYTVNFVL
jgi:hypothetical protein